MICLHVGSTGVADMPAGAPMVPLGATLFGQLSLSACARSGCGRAIAVRHPDLKIIMSEGGIGWVAMLHDRLENIVDRSGYGHYFPGDLRPAEVLRRNFWFATIDDPSTLSTRVHDRHREHHLRVRLSRTATARGPTRKRCSPTCSAGSRPTRSRRSATRTRPRCSAIRYRRQVEPARGRTAVMTECPATTRRCCATRICDEVRGRRVLRCVGAGQPDAKRREKLETLQTVEARTVTTMDRLLGQVGLKVDTDPRAQGRPRARPNGSGRGLGPN